jgi:xanthine dehydrogenase accessory factor
MLRRGWLLSDSQIVSKLSQLIATGKQAVLCTLIWKKGSGPREQGAKMLVSSEEEVVGTIGGGGMERLLVNKALDVIREGKPKTIHFALGVPPRGDMIAVDSKCGGEVKIFLDLIKPDPRLIIMGSGLIAQAVARYANLCDFKVIIIDDAKTAKQEYFPGMMVINEPYPQSLKQVDIRSSDYVAILHGETGFEVAGLRYAVEHNPAYIGLLGSSNKREAHIKQLLEEGYDLKIIEKIKGPIGLNISAETPEEIGVSIIAEIIKKKRD